LDLPLALILLSAALLRLTNLAYSHFQGDEVKALYPPDAAFPDFLFDQKKGPIQFLVTLLVRLVTGGYEEWVTRLPFALASLFAVYIVYRLVRHTFGRFPALVSAALLGTCGLVTAFGRVVQYQSFGILFVLVTASFMFGWLRNSNPRHLYLGFVFYALALLTHYDALAFAPTLGIIVITGFRRHTGASHSHTRHLLVAGATGSLLAGLFYIPYMLQPNFPAVKDYLLGRIASGSGMQTFASTYALLGLYLPPLYLAVTIPLLVCGVVRVLRRPRAITGLIFLFWFVSVFAFYMLLGGDPRSHVYNYFLPGLVLVALGLEGVVESAGNLLLKRALQTAIWVLIIGSGSITYYILVDHTVEHPWYAKKVLGYTLPHLEARNIDGVFGFPYQRGLHTVGLLFQSGQLRGTFDSNERDAMADYYFRARRASPPDYYVYVHRPLSLRRDLPAFLTPDYWVIAEISVGGTKTIDIYESRLPNRGGQDAAEPASCGRPDPRGAKRRWSSFTREVSQTGLPSVQWRDADRLMQSPKQEKKYTTRRGARLAFRRIAENLGIIPTGVTLAADLRRALRRRMP
jgi:hypothetical protein